MAGEAKMFYITILPAGNWPKLYSKLRFIIPSTGYSGTSRRQDSLVQARAYRQPGKLWHQFDAKES